MGTAILSLLRKEGFTAARENGARVGRKGWGEGSKEGEFEGNIGGVRHGKGVRTRVNACWSMLTLSLKTHDCGKKSSMMLYNLYKN